MTRPGLTRQLTIALLGYALLLSLLVSLHGYLVNEHAEALTWESLLVSELQHFQQRHQQDPAYRWMDTDILRLYGALNQRPIPASLADLAPGVHDEVLTDEGEFVVLVDGTDTDRTVMTLDIANMERSEVRLGWLIGLSSLVVVALLTLIAHIGLRRLVRPLVSLAQDIGALSPDRAGQRIAVDPKAPHEALTIARALNEHLDHIDRFVEREREFVSMASHELRTPIAVIGSTAEVALDNEHTSAAVQPQLQHILNTARDMEKLTTLLLALAKDPARLQATTESIDLAQLLPEVAAHYRIMAQRKELQLRIDVLPSSIIEAPRPVVAAAIGNLLRNAIENSDRGTVVLALTEGGAVMVKDPGHGMSVDEIRHLYSQLARSGTATGGGIGIPLIARLCEHLGWRLAFESHPERGTTATLRFISSTTP